MFTPMALTVLMALLGAAIFSMTFVPAAVAIFVTGRFSEKENFFMRGAKRVYLPLLGGAIQFPGSVVVDCGGDRRRQRICGDTHGRRVHPEPRRGVWVGCETHPQSENPAQ